MLDAEKIAEYRGLVRDLTTVLEKRNAAIAGLRAAMNNAIALLSDTDLHAEERAGNGMLCLANALNQTE